MILSCVNRSSRLDTPSRSDRSYGGKEYHVVRRLDWASNPSSFAARPIEYIDDPLTILDTTHGILLNVRSVPPAPQRSPRTSNK